MHGPCLTSGETWRCRGNVDPEYWMPFCWWNRWFETSSCEDCMEVLAWTKLATVVMGLGRIYDHDENEQESNQ